MTPQPSPRKPHEQRVLSECLELAEKLDRLETFIAGPVFCSIPEAERSRLKRQAIYMRLYVIVLNERIGAFV